MVSTNLNIGTMNIRIETYRERAKLRYKVSVCDGKLLVREDVVNSLEERDELVWSLAQIYDIGDIQFVDTRPTQTKELTIVNVSSISDLTQYFEDNKYRIYNQVLDTVELGIAEGKDKSVFAALQEQGTHLMSNRSGWLAGLRLALAYFEAVEDYESCARAAELITKLTSYDNDRKANNIPRR